MKKILMFLSLSILLNACAGMTNKNSDNQNTVEDSNNTKEIVHYLVREDKSNDKTRKLDISQNEAWRYGLTKFKSKKNLGDNQILTIYNSPDIYTINLENLNALHEIDKEKPAIIQAPIIDDDKIDLEFGQEFEFFKDNKAEKSHELIGFIAYDKYHLELDGYQINLYTKENNDLPVYLTYAKNEIKSILAYQTYERLPFKKDVFNIPEKLNILNESDIAPN